MGGVGAKETVAGAPLITGAINIGQKIPSLSLEPPEVD